MVLLDVIVIALIALGAYSGHKKGLVGILVGFASLILSIVLAFALQSVVAEALYNSSLGKSLNTTISSSIQDKLDDGEDINNIQYVKLLNLEFSQEQEISNISQAVTKFILKGASFIIIFLDVKIICYILQMILNLVFNLPILNQINGIGGTAVGALSMILKICIVLAIISFVSPLPVFEPVVAYLDKTILIKFLYNNNFLVSLLKIGLKI